MQTFANFSDSLSLTIGAGREKLLSTYSWWERGSRGRRLVGAGLWTGEVNLRWVSLGGTHDLQTKQNDDTLIPADIYDQKKGAFHDMSPAAVKTELIIFYLDFYR